MKDWKPLCELSFTCSLVGKCNLHAFCLRSPLPVLLGLLVRSWELLLNPTYSLTSYMVVWNWISLPMGIWPEEWWPAHTIMRSCKCTEIALWWWVYCCWFWAAILNLVQVKVESNIYFCFFLSAYFYAKSIIRSVIEVSLFICRYNTLPSRRTLKNSRLVSKKDDVHVCIMCLRAIMNYQVCLCFWSLKKNLNLSNSKLVLFGFLVLFLFEVNIRIKWDSIEKERTVFFSNAQYLIYCLIF